MHHLGFSGDGLAKQDPSWSLSPFCSGSFDYLTHHLLDNVATSPPLKESFDTPDLGVSGLCCLSVKWLTRSLSIILHIL